MSQKRLKVMLVTPYFAPKIGGLENYALELAKKLKQQGLQIIVVTTNHAGKGKKEETVEGFRVIRLPILFKLSNTPFNPLWRFQLKRLIRAEQPDIINAHAPVPGLADMAIRASGPIPTVLTYHAATLRKQGSFAMQVATRITEVLQRKTFKRATKIVAVSDYVKEHLPKSVQLKTKTVTNSIDLQSIPVHGIRRNHNRLIFVGSLDQTHDWKGLNDILDAVRIAVKKRPKLELHVIGDGNARVAYETRAAKLGIADRVVFHGFVQGDAKFNLIRSGAALLAYPTTSNDAFPTVFPEAWACKTPIIAARIGALESLVTDNVTGVLVKPHSPRALANAIVKTLSSKTTIDSLVKAGFQHVSEDLTWDTAATKTKDLFTQVAGQPIVYAANVAVDNSLAPAIHIQEICNNLSKLGRDVTLFAPSIKEGTATNFTAIRVPKPKILRPLAPLTFQFRLGRTLYRHLKHNRNAILYTRQEAFMFAPTIVSKLLHVPLVIENNGAISEEALADGRLPLRGIWRRLGIFQRIEGSAYKQATHIFTVTAGLKNRLIDKYHVNANAITVAENGVNVDLLKPLNVNRPSDELRIGFVGHLTPWEGMSYAVQAMVEVRKKLPNAKLLIAGDGEQLEELKHLVAQLQLQDAVTLLGRIDHDTVPTFINSCDICIAYYTKERSGLNSPFKVYEYLACGKPVVVSDIVGLGDHFGDAVATAVPEDAASLAKQLIKLLKNNRKRQAMSKRALHFMDKQHSWQDVASIIDNRLQRLTNRVGTPWRPTLWASYAALYSGSLLTEWIGKATPLGISLHILNFCVVLGGLFTLALKKKRELNFIEWLTLTIGLSTASLMIGGWLLNTVGLTFSWHALTAAPILAMFYAVEGVLLFATAKQKTQRIHITTNWRVIVPLLFPILGAFGAERLNNVVGGEIAIGSLALILAWQAYLFASHRSLSSGDIASDLWGTSTALLLSVALRSNHLIGYDIHQEYQVFRGVFTSGMWHPASLKNTYNACLSITILPTVLAHLLNVPTEYVFKLIMQLLAGFVPLIVYKLARVYGRLDKKLALISALFFLLQLQFVLQFPALIRQEISFIFFGLILLIGAIDAFSLRMRKVLLLLFGMCMIVSHYSTSIVAIIVLCAVIAMQYISLKLWKKLQARHLPDKSGLSLIFRPALVLFLIVFSFLWYVEVTNTTGNLGHKIDYGIKHLNHIETVLKNSTRSTFVTNTLDFKTSSATSFSVSTLEKTNITAHGYGKQIYNRYPVVPVSQRGATAHNSVGKFVLLVSKLGIPALVKIAFIAGIAVLVMWAWRGQSISFEMGVIAFVATAMMIGLVVIPGVSQKYNLDRLYQQLIVILAAAPIIGMQRILKKRPTWLLGCAAVLILAYGASTTGLIDQLFFRAGDINLSNNNETYVRYYTTDADIAGLTWLNNEQNHIPAINFDRYTALNADAYTTIPSRSIVPSVLPGRLEPEFYTFQSSMNTLNGTAYDVYKNTSITYQYPTVMLQTLKDTVYTNGNVTIYK